MESGGLGKVAIPNVLVLQLHQQRVALQHLRLPKTFSMMLAGLSVYHKL